MGDFNEELVEAGVMLAGFQPGQHPDDLQRLDPLRAQSLHVESTGALLEVGVRHERLHQRAERAAQRSRVMR